ncbi:hypothetical protein FHR84_004212 [Actinopolyspora biskrensis]|uniref:Uncharacterized protein n=1 Tax=Actinopolyspora biskrensis TaxID=1470178 RepID=A0A852Z0Q5_9ACTN|nr:hypothetical protein [Actinopolyspora biskrensis]
MAVIGDASPASPVRDGTRVGALGMESPGAPWLPGGRAARQRFLRGAESDTRIGSHGACPWTTPERWNPFAGTRAQFSNCCSARLITE